MLLNLLLLKLNWLPFAVLIAELVVLLDMELNTLRILDLPKSLKLLTLHLELLYI
jgi:hypothetical protein